MPGEYVRLVEGQYLAGGTRVSLDSLVYLYRDGMSAESMVDSYPALTLEQVHAALAFYLGTGRRSTPIFPKVNAALSRSTSGPARRMRS
jgi:uncharacterized protein (DUF433 family)